MMNAGVPYPFCRFIIDLLGGEDRVDADGILFRNDNAFTSFTDVVDDINQMKDNPARYLHPSLKDVWRSVFEQMHGREMELNKLLEVASRVCGFKSNDALMEALAMLRSSHRQQVVFVTGQAGAGKTSLVMEMKKGWFFLSCKFERTIHAEPLSVVASAFDDFLQHCKFVQCRNRLGLFIIN
eukprot:scaffold14139_cov74-Cyclotella_meneghiniana.AAC.20